jgi:hypothetical protein
MAIFGIYHDLVHKALAQETSRAGISIKVMRGGARSPLS